MLIIGIDEAFSKGKIDKSVSNLKLIFKTNIEREEVLRDIKKSNLLIFASETESFGLPLLEASGYGVDIIAADADYVLETCRPKFLFNPKEPKSLIRALTLYFELNDFPNLINVCDLEEILFQ